ncbi:hypothetical protein Droror1_Dr00024838 [Drosera rotundifolia]
MNAGFLREGPKRNSAAANPTKMTRRFTTVSAVSVAYSQPELLQKEVFLVELVDSISMSKEAMSHLKAVYFVRPTSENIQLIRRQLATPRFGEYHLCESVLPAFV